MSHRSTFMWWTSKWLAVWWPIRLHLPTRCWTVWLKAVTVALRNHIQLNVESVEYGWRRIIEERKLRQDLWIVWGREMYLFYVLYVLETCHLITLGYCHFTAFQLEILKCVCLCVWEREREHKPSLVVVVVVAVAAAEAKWLNVHLLQQLFVLVQTQFPRNIEAVDFIGKYCILIF